MATVFYFTFSPPLIYSKYQAYGLFILKLTNEVSIILIPRLNRSPSDLLAKRVFNGVMIYIVASLFINQLWHYLLTTKSNKEK